MSKTIWSHLQQCFVSKSSSIEFKNSSATHNEILKRMKCSSCNDLMDIEILSILGKSNDSILTDDEMYVYIKSHSQTNHGTGLMTNDSNIQTCSCHCKQMQQQVAMIDNTLEHQTKQNKTLSSRNPFQAYRDEITETIAINNNKESRMEVSNAKNNQNSNSKLCKNSILPMRKLKEEFVTDANEKHSHIKLDDCRSSDCQSIQQRTRTYTEWNYDRRQWESYSNPFQNIVDTPDLYRKSSTGTKTI